MHLASPSFQAVDCNKWPILQYTHAMLPDIQTAGTMFVLLFTMFSQIIMANNS